MNEEKKHDETPEEEPKKLSEEELKDAAGGFTNSDWSHERKGGKKGPSYRGERGPRG